MASQRRQSPLDAVAIKYLSLVKNFLQKENPRKLVQFSRVQRLLIMKAITPEQWTKLVSELFSRNPTLLKATAALTKISANAKDPSEHLAWRVATLATRSASPLPKSPSPSSQGQKRGGEQVRPAGLTSITPTNNNNNNRVQNISPGGLSPSQQQKMQALQQQQQQQQQQPGRRNLMAWQGTKSTLRKELRGVNVFSRPKRGDPSSGGKTPSPFQNSAMNSNKISPFGMTPSSSAQQQQQPRQTGKKLGFNSLTALKSFSNKSRSPKVTPHVSPSSGLSSTKSKFLKATRQTQGAQGALGALMAARQMQNQRSRFADVAGKTGRSPRILPKSKIRRRMSSRRKKQTKFQKISKLLTVPCVVLLFLLIISIFSWMGVEVNYIYKRINSAISESSDDIDEIRETIDYMKNRTIEDTSTVYGEISLLYDSSFVFTEPYKQVFRKVVSSYLDTVHEDAVNILSVDDILPPNSRRRLERNVVGVSSISKDDTKGAETLKNAPSSPSPYIFATSSSSSSSNKLSPTSQTNNMISPSITSSRSSILKKYVKKINNKRNLEQASAIPIGNQIFFKIKDISQTYASAVALRIRDMEETFMPNFQEELKNAQLTEPAKLSSQFGGTKISVFSGSGEGKSEVFVPELQQKIVGDCGEQGAIRRILPNGTIFCKTSTAIKATSILMTPGEQTSFKLEANEDYMTVNTKDKNILFQMPVQISENGIQGPKLSLISLDKSSTTAASRSVATLGPRPQGPSAPSSPICPLCTR